MRAPNRTPTSRVLPPASGTAAQPGRSRALGIALLLLHCWIAVVFPVVHAAIEPGGAPRVGIAAEDTPWSSPGHDHQHCRVCNTAPNLAPTPNPVVQALTADVVQHVAEFQFATDTPSAAPGSSLGPRAPPLA